MAAGIVAVGIVAAGTGAGVTAVCKGTGGGVSGFVLSVPQSKKSKACWTQPPQKVFPQVLTPKSEVVLSIDWA